MSDDLIPEEEPHNWTSGAGLLSDASTLLGDINNGADGLDWTVDGVSAGLDTIITLADPFGAAVAAGVGWILENIPGISDLWNDLSGNPEEINRASITWHNIAARLKEQGEAFDTQAGTIETWKGDAAQSFAQVAKDYSTIVPGVASDAEFLSIVTAGMGAIIAALREVVYWAISAWLTEDVIPEALASLATSWCTFGASIAAFLTWLIISTSLTFGVLGEKIADASVKFAEVYAKIGEALTKLGAGKDALKFGIEGLASAGKALDQGYVWGPRGAVKSGENRHKGMEEGG